MALQDHLENPSDKEDANLETQQKDSNTGESLFIMEEEQMAQLSIS